MEPLRIVRAGAGSGKTYTIQKHLVDRVVAGEVAADRIAAVTYTEAAARELQDRIRLGLLNAGRVEDALRLSQAYICTIHSFGLRILSEFAFEAGTSPRPRLLTDYEQNSLVRRALATTDDAGFIADDLRAFGYNYDAVSGRSEVEVLRDHLLVAVNLLRGIHADTPDRVGTLIDRALRELRSRYRKIYNPIRARHGLPSHKRKVCDPGRARKRLHAAVRKLLKDFPESLETGYVKSKTAKAALQADFAALDRAGHTHALRNEWRVWQRLRKLRLSKRGSPLGELYEARAKAVIRRAGKLDSHPGPLWQASEHLKGLLLAAHDVHRHYSRAKRKAGLVDYSDMTASAARLLRERPDVLKRLAAQIDCLVVDEFQDTNPLQFALLWSLRAHGIPTLVVGDLKQSIMGFQGADPRLFAALARNHPEASSSLTRNWRSQPRLMAVINALGKQLFGSGYTELAPQGRDSRLHPLDVVISSGKLGRSPNKIVATRTCEHLATLLSSPRQTVIDRATNAQRRLRGGDIAVICPTNRLVALYGDCLREAGLPVHVPSDGWLQSRPVQIARHALSYLANAADRHSALYLAVTEMGSLGIEEGLRQLMDHGQVRDPLLRKLDELADGVADRSVYALTADTLDAMGLFDEVAAWPDSEQARANLIRLLALAAEFMNADRSALAHGGYHGSGILSFLAWLDERTKVDNGQPEATVVEEDAISVRTWHGSKGLEWPVVAVCGLQQTFRPRLPHLSTAYDSFEDLGEVLQRSYLQWYPKYDAPEQNEAALDRLRDRAESERRRLLYVALSRAREKLVLEWPLYLQRLSVATPRYWTFLRWDASVDSKTRQMTIGTETFACRVVGTSQAGGRRPETNPAGADEDSRADSVDSPAFRPAKIDAPAYGRLAIRRERAPDHWTPDSTSPSLIETEAGAERLSLRCQRCGLGLNPQLGLAGTDLGTFLHRCFELLGANPALAGSLAALTGVEVDSAARDEIAAAVARFERWVQSELKPREVLREWPALALDKHGTVISGTIDLLVRARDGCWILDHKSDSVDDPEEAVRRYVGQLGAYRHAVEEAGETVLGLGIHWIRSGHVTWVELPRGSAPAAGPDCARGTD